MASQKLHLRNFLNGTFAGVAVNGVLFNPGYFESILNHTQQEMYAVSCLSSFVSPRYSASK